MYIMLDKMVYPCIGILGNFMWLSLLTPVAVLSDVLEHWLTFGSDSFTDSVTASLIITSAYMFLTIKSLLLSLLNVVI